MKASSLVSSASNVSRVPREAGSGKLRQELRCSSAQLGVESMRGSVRIPPLRRMDRGSTALKELV